jgi:glycosyltransferase involved in cell wall biosynthesis
MRVALIAPPYESVPPKLYGGTERVVHNLCQGLQRAGIDVTLFASGDSECPGVPLVPVVDQALRLRRPAVRDPASYHLRTLAIAARHAREFDLIHNHDDYWMLPLSELSDTPVLSTLHGRLDLSDIPAAFLSYPKASFVSISNSQRGPLGLLNWAGTIYHGMEFDHLEFKPEPGRYLAFLGRISWEKAPHWAIEIALQSGIPLKIAAKIEGRESQEYFDARIRPYVDGKFIEYVGEINESEKSEFLGNALGLVFPIDWPEPFGLVMIEALACGTPVLARPLGSVPELLCSGVTGFHSLDIRELARKAPELARIDRARCREWALGRYSLPRMIEEYIDVYRRLARPAEFADHRRNLVHSV